MIRRRLQSQESSGCGPRGCWGHAHVARVTRFVGCMLNSNAVLDFIVNGTGKPLDYQDQAARANDEDS
ncbi:hypothetical protein WOLCODRAFT_25690 [Wolfiporia cocos MD-104 SS10]|uniref:Uncharacterized protein n=1 Tax=Wolfiporia cocos (strain MD-104) TaxID=742152 RepID=A0A2H3K1X2_WOLCO|nr:hypothetical protein WOLCODRAFT_25690 [Wolfiporia cocos MD-104 SS10]